MVLAEKNQQRWKIRLALFNNEKTVHSFYKTENVLDPDGNVAGTKVVLNIKFKNTVQQPAKELI